MVRIVPTELIIIGALCLLAIIVVIVVVVIFNIRKRSKDD